MIEEPRIVPLTNKTSQGQESHFVKNIPVSVKILVATYWKLNATCAS